MTKAKLKFRLNGQTIQKGQEIPADMVEAAKERGYAVSAPARETKPKAVKEGE